MDYPWNVVALLFAGMLIAITRAVVAWNLLYNFSLDMVLLACMAACGLVAIGLVLSHYA